MSGPSVHPGDRDPRTIRPAHGYLPGEPVWAWCAGRWEPAIVLTSSRSRVLVRHRIDRAVPEQLVLPRDPAIGQAPTR
jgi:hypothetical protein